MVYCLAMNVRDKVVIVTGASAGIGLATAKLLAKQGAKVALAARSQEKLQELSQELASSFAIPTDMSDATSVGRTVAAVHENYGRIDALINNAARGLYGIVEKVEIASYRAIWALNVEGPLIAMQKVIPLMRAQGGGSIVNISSMVSKNYFPRIGAYASTKYALNALSLTARAELAPDHIIVSVVYPGLVETDFGKNAIKFGEETRGMESRRREHLPEPDSPGHVASRILFALESGQAEVFMHDA
jgi:NAD(P)-dependent dehydrogenase (short-subunit alcohol dehydrogenase family)